jgi:putative transposase
LCALPTGKLIERLKQLCPEYGIVLTITEEAYTSKASFLDDDLVPKYGEKPRNVTLRVLCPGTFALML